MAVFDIEDKGSQLEPRVLDVLTEYLSARLTEGGFQVIPRDQIKARLVDERRESYKECYEQSCQIELGRELAAEKALATKILRIGDTCQLTAVLFDLKKSTTERAATSEAACHEKSLLVAVREVSDRLAGPLHEKESKESASKTPTELDSFLQDVKREKTEKEREEMAWSTIREIAVDHRQPAARRVAALRKFLAEFKEKSLHAAEANQLLVKLLPGFLTVTTNPEGARVLLDGSLVGGSPITMKLEAGRYQVSAVKEGFLEASRTVEVRLGDKTSVSLALEKELPGTLVVETEPEGAPVTIAGEPAGSSPVTRELAPGRYRVAVAREGYFSTERKVSVESARRIDLKVVMRKVPPPYAAWGHVAFWTGIGLAAFGGASAFLSSSAADDYAAGDRGARDESKTWAGMMYTGLGAGGALLITGIVLWALSSGDEQPAEWIGPSFGLAPGGDGLGLSISGRW